ncbi:MAG: chloride channel protein [Bacteroidetes bacterium]|nr:MAG: chloride channel protein [Bacteroidota bacterium]
MKKIFKALEWLVDFRIKYIKQRPFVISLSIVIGITAGIVATLIKKAVHWTEYLLTHFFVPYAPNFLYFMYPLIGIGITILIVKYLIRNKVQEGIPNTLFAISKRQANIKPHNLFSSIITSAFTVGFGGSVGLEGPTVATSAAWGSTFGRLFRVDYKTKILLVSAGVTGSMAAIFQAPIAAIVFAVEVIMIDLTTASLIPLLFSSIAAYLTSQYMLGETILIDFAIADKYTLSDVPYFIFLGILLGFGSVYYSRVYFGIANILNRYSTWQKLLLGGAVLGLMIYLLPPLYGEGYITINNLINGRIGDIFENTFFYSFKDNFLVIAGFLIVLFFLKIVAASLTLHIGGVGGIFAPTLFMGATGGYLFGNIVNKLGLGSVSEVNFTLVGMAGMLAGVLYAPLTAIFLIAELSKGYSLFVPLMITSLSSFVTASIFIQNSIYSQQLANRGELLTHHADNNVLKMMNLKKEIENDFSIIHPNQSLGELVEIIALSKRNIFPVIDENHDFKGVVFLDNVRTIMFQKEKYEDIHVYDIMVSPPDFIDYSDKMSVVMNKFEITAAWNLPVLKNGKYMGFVSKSKLFTNYRELLKEFSDY